MIKKLFYISLSILFVMSFAISNAQASVLQTLAKQAIIIDVETGTVLFEKNADQRTPTSSMSKVLTMAVVLDALQDGRISLDDKFKVSEKAWKKGGSKMFVEHGTRVKVSDLIQGVIVQSGNDATIVLAEGIAGSEEDFVKLLNAKAQEIGMNDSHFANASGWPDPDHYSTARDLAKLALYLINQYPEYYHYYGQKEFEYNDIKQSNRNPLLFRGLGADGIKTGHTEDAGYGFMASAVKDGRRVVMIVNGLDSLKRRGTESARLMGWALNEFENIEFLKAGQVLDQANIWLGKERQVPLIIHKNMKLTVPVKREGQIQAKIVREDPVMAPVYKGQEMAKIHIEIPGHGTVERTLYAGKDSPKLGFLGQGIEKIRYLLFGVE